MTQAFIEERLPEEVERRAIGGPMFKTLVTTLFSGHEQRNVSWSQARGEWDIGYGLSHLKEGKSQSYLNDVIAFFYARRGRAIGFRFKDWTDFELSNTTIGLGDTSTTAFQIVKIYKEASATAYVRTLNKIVDSTEVVQLDGVPQVSGYTIDYDTGIVTFSSPPGSAVVVSVACEFDVPVRFDIDKLDIVAFTQDTGLIQTIPLVELRQD